MSRGLRVVVVLLAAGCSSDPPAPAAAPEPVTQPTIETASVTPATATPEPIEPRAAKAAAAPEQPVPPMLSREQVEKTFDHHRRYFQQLYREHRANKPKLGGTIFVSFSIAPNGSTQGATVAASNVGDAAFEQAVLGQVAQMTFPPAAGATPVERFPLQFSAASSK
jgi:TonB family protein